MSSNTEQTAKIISTFNQAFLSYAPELLPPLIAEHCVLENISPAPEGDRTLGRAACLARWQSLAANRDGAFELEDTLVMGDRAVIFWRYRWGGSNLQRGVNIMHVSNGQIVEGRGYVKA